MPRSPITPLAALAMIAALLAGSAATAAEPQYDQVSFSVQAESDLPNDLAAAVLTVEKQGADPAKVAEAINRTMSWALDRARGAEAVSFQTADYQTYPVYDEKARLLRWRGTQNLVLRSPKIEALTALAGALQQRLQIKSLQFMPSPEQQRDGEAQLTDQVLAQFKERAARIQHDLGAQGYRIVRLDLNSGGTPRAFSRMALAEKAPAAVAAEPGVSRLQLSAHAVIELQH